MRLILTPILLIILIVFTSACEKKSRSVSDIEFAMKISGKESYSQKEVILIVPNAGCEGCVTEAENFIMNYISTELNWQVVFTQISSKKTLKLKLGEDIYHHENVYIDSSNHFYQNSLISLFPTVVYTSNGEIKEVVQQSPENPNTLADLERFFLN